MKTLSRFLLLIFAALTINNAQELGELTVQKIMRDPAWIGNSPSDLQWSFDSKTIYFKWNPDNENVEPLYKYSIETGITEKVSTEEQKSLPSQWGDYSGDESKFLYAKEGDLYLLDLRSGKTERLTETNGRESDPAFIDEKTISYVFNDNLFTINLTTGKVKQLTDFNKGNGSKKNNGDNEKDEWIAQENMKLIKTLEKRKADREAAIEHNKLLDFDRPEAIYTNGLNITSQQLSPDGKYVTFRLYKWPDNKGTAVPEYVTESAYVEEGNGRAKVGGDEGTYKFGIYNLESDSVYYVDPKEIPGIYDKPEFLKEYGKYGDGKYEEPRNVIVYGTWWSEDGKYAVLVVRSTDNKDKWFLRLDPETGSVNLLDRQRDEAWVGGPGVSGWWGTGTIGWLDDNKHIYYQSEETGYSHLYIQNVETGEKKQLTFGEYEVTEVELSKNGEYFFITSSEASPFERHLYKLPVTGGLPAKVTQMEGNNNAAVSPDNRHAAILYSYSNKPWDLFLRDLDEPKPAVRITDSQTEEFKSYDWRVPEIVYFEAEDGAKVPARLYRPENPKANGPAVIFVHGAGYLQNVHRWWSSYFREYMFHNMLADNGYTVLDIDYRASSGYGRDWRTAIYRYMGGKDLSDQVDGAEYLVEEYNVNPGRIGIYGGSYGGFITLMAMFKEPGIFKSGAALRSVTDWAHYNHGYTANILNTPVQDSIAYVRSSPIYFAEGLKGNLLMCHGMEDSNVQFQDIIRLSQRLIELGKDDWELAVYPLEGHGFAEPESWTDEYLRIFKLFEETLK